MFSTAVRKVSANYVFNTRHFSFSSLLKCNSVDEEQAQIEYRNISKDRSAPIAPEVSIEYLESSAYQETYGDRPVWLNFRRVHKGLIPPRKTRKTCIRHGKVSTGSPCPICRDEYLVIDFHNRKLLQQFISPYTGAIISYKKTNICQKQHKELLIAVAKARNRGLLTFDVPHRDYREYSHYYSQSN